MALAMMGAKGASDNDDEKETISRANTGAVKSTKVHKIVIPHREGQVIDVYPWFEITITDINVPNQTFNVSVECYIFWQEYGLPKAFPTFETELFKLDEEDVPVKLSEVFENKIAHNFSDDVTFKYHSELSCVEMAWISEVTFVERMELQKFPLDRQFLNMQFNAWVNTEKVKWNWILKPPAWVPKEYHKPICVRAVSSITEYELLSPWIEFEKDEPPLTIRMRVDRLPQYYFGNIVLPNFLIVAACFSSFVIPPNELGDRLGVTVTLMLAAVAFRFVISTMLPKVNYLTYMDYYILFGFVALAFLIAENAIAGISHIGKGAKVLDYLFGLVFGACWILVHVVAIVCIISKTFLRLSWEEMDALDKAEDPADEFTKAEDKDVKGNPESKESMQKWESYKVKSPMTRATDYNKNPNLKKINEEKEMDEMKLDDDKKTTEKNNNNNNNSSKSKGNQSPKKVNKEEEAMASQIALNGGENKTEPVRKESAKKEIEPVRKESAKKETEPVRRESDLSIKESNSKEKQANEREEEEQSSEPVVINVVSTDL